MTQAARATPLRVTSPLPPPSIPPTLLLVGAGSPDNQGFGLERIAAAHRVILIDQVASDWARRHLAGHTSCDLGDPASVVSAAIRLAQIVPVGGVLAGSAVRVGLAAQVARRLGLPAPAARGVRASHDTAFARRLLTLAQVPTLRTAHAASESAAVREAALLGYPVLVRPDVPGPSSGCRADTPDGLRRAYRTVSTASSDKVGVLVEELGQGSDASIEGVLDGSGQLAVTAIVRTTSGTWPVPATGHAVDASDPLLADAGLRAHAAAAVRAVGLKRGPVHIPLRLTAHGYRLLSVQPVLAADLVPRLVELATGVDLPRAAATAVMGGRPLVEPTQHRAAAVRFLSPPAAGYLESAQTGAPLGAEWLERFRWTRHLGTYVHGPEAASFTDRLAQFIVTGRDREQCLARLGLVEEQTVLRIRPHIVVHSCVW
ncbi:carboxylase [Streptomyces bobili]|uniref:ATP-grasp domain-containing protein n=1 Tax=Streptomyces bobili TaxID=67280 RepID=UPI003415A7D6